MIASYYNSSSTCPMHIFRRVMSSSDFKAMKRIGIATKKGCLNAFAKVFNDADSKFNIAEKYRQYLSKRMKAVEFYQKAVKGKRHYFTRAKVLELEAENLLAGGSNVQYEMACAMLTKKVGVFIDPNKLTVAQYYAFFEMKE